MWLFVRKSCGRSLNAMEHEVSPVLGDALEEHTATYACVEPARTSTGVVKAALKSKLPEMLKR